MSSRRTYRRTVPDERFAFFNVTVKETDLWIAVKREHCTPSLPEEIQLLVWKQRRLIEDYLRRYPDFGTALEPCLLDLPAPPPVLDMARAANLAGVGPMAAVAGTLAEIVGRYLLRQADEVIVENGGDIFLRVVEPVSVGVYAGSSPLSNRLALIVDPAHTPLGVCTSSGTVGPSLSFGRADAAVILSPSAALADAAATAVGNLVKSPEDLDSALEYARGIAGVTGALLIAGDRLAAWGAVQLKPL